MPNIYMLVAALVAAIACSFFGYQAGESANEGKHAIADRVAQDKFDAALAAANLKLRTEEQASAKRISDADTAYQQKLKEHNNATNKTVADIRSGRISLRIPTCPSAASGGALSGSPAAPGSSDGESPGDFSRRLAEDVAGRLAKCDEAAIALDLAQQVIISDRK
jgi:hypothetical protein